MISAFREALHDVDPREHLDPEEEDEIEIRRETSDVAKATPRRRSYEAAVRNKLLWSHFELIDKETARCKHCNAERKRSDANTTGITKHLSKSHPDIYEEYLRLRKEEADMKTESEKKGAAAREEHRLSLERLAESRGLVGPKSRPQQRTLLAYAKRRMFPQVKKYNPLHKDQLRIDLEIMLAIACLNLPFNITGAKAFVRSETSCVLFLDHWYANTVTLLFFYSVDSTAIFHCFILFLAGF